jgi:hypothetical protein
VSTGSYGTDRPKCGRFLAALTPPYVPQQEQVLTLKGFRFLNQSPYVSKWVYELTHPHLIHPQNWSSVFATAMGFKMGNCLLYV